MKRFLPLVCILVACADSPDIPCDAHQACAAGQICDVEATGGTPMCIDEAGDEDGDGVRNAVDLCLHQAGGMFDEDGDRIGDECDRCPISPPPLVPDSDNDAVDSPCDPNPYIPGDKIVFFDGFHTPSNRWNLNRPYHMADGDLIYTPPNATNVEHRTTGIPRTRDLVAFTEYRIDEIAPDAHEVDVTITAPDLGIYCGGQRSDSKDLLYLQLGSRSETGPVARKLFDPQTSYLIRQRFDGETSSCSFKAPDGIGLIAGRTDREFSGLVGLRARGATVRFGFVLVVAQAR
jgi:hypothetical protein